MPPIKVLIVDDSALMRQLLTHMLGSAEDIEVVGSATDPYDARQKIKQLLPDVLTLDIEMPHMDGLAFLERVMTLRPMPVIMVSSLTQHGAKATLRALELGAFDLIKKPDHAAMDSLTAELQEKVRAAASARLVPHPVPPLMVRPLHYKAKREGAPVIAIGASTGGVEALRLLLAQLPSLCPPVIITQHMPAAFTRSFAARLDGLSEMTVVQAVHGARLQNGYALLAPGDQHLTIRRQGEHYICQLDAQDPVFGHRPSVDRMFQSVAEQAGADAIGVLLTGMGRDGAAGLLRMRERGAYTIAQDEASCVVYGMPKAAVALEAVARQLPLNEIPRHVLDISKKRKAL